MDRVRKEKHICIFRTLTYNVQPIIPWLPTLTLSTSVLILGYYFKFIFLSLHFLLIALARQEEVKTNIKHIFFFFFLSGSTTLMICYTELTEVTIAACCLSKTVVKISHLWLSEGHDQAILNTKSNSVLNLVFSSLIDTSNFFLEVHCSRQIKPKAVI